MQLRPLIPRRIMIIEVANTDDDIVACHRVLAQLRPHLGLDGCVGRVRELLASTGFRLAFLRDGEVHAVAGYRVADWLHAGRYLEIEDLVTDSSCRSRGHGGRLSDWLVAEATREGCRQLRLLSGTQRLDAHRFYQRKGMKIEAYYFSMPLPV